LALSAVSTKVQNAFKPFGTIRKKIPFVENYKEFAICAILREKTHFVNSQRLKKVLRVLRCAKNTPQRPPKNANPSELSEKNVYSLESLQFWRSGGNFSFERGGVGPSEKC